MVNMLLYCNTALVTKGFDHCPVPAPQRSLIIESQVSTVNDPACALLDLLWCLIQTLCYVYIVSGDTVPPIDQKLWFICKSEALIIKTLS